MKNHLRLFALVLCMGVALSSCRNEEKKATDNTEMNSEMNSETTVEETAAEKMNMDPDAEVKVKDDKIKMEDDTKKVKIKTDEDGTVDKTKVEYKDEN